ncbi:hypothetical protein [Labrys monachus]|nr:hypothetical protein [Labrys monachus]
MAAITEPTGSVTTDNAGPGLAGRISHHVPPGDEGDHGPGLRELTSGIFILLSFWSGMAPIIVPKGKI